MAHPQLRHRVLVTHALPGDWLKSLEATCDILSGPSVSPGFPAEMLDQLGDAQGLLTLLHDRVDETLLSRAPALRVVSNMAAGLDNIDVAACTRRGIPVGHTPGALTDATADLAFALLLCTARGILHASDDARSGRWIGWAPAGWLGLDLAGRTLGIIGLGKIGGAVARRAAGFGMQVMCLARPGSHSTAERMGVREVSLPELLAQSDFVSLHTPLTPETRGLIDAAALRMMKPSAVLINTARGAVVQTDALSQALREGWICAAALDVTDPEPLPAEHVLYQMSNCLVTPHIASATHQTRRRIAGMAAENLLAGLQGNRLPYCANPSVYGQA
jgi:glyoxylate reductase